MRRIIIGLIAFSCGAAAHAQTPVYLITGRIPASDALWDYAAVDESTSRLYLGRAGGVLALDLKTNTVTPQLVSSRLVHGVLPIGNDVVSMAESASNTVGFFDGRTGTVIARTPTGRSSTASGWHDPDALAFDPSHGLVAAVNGDSGSVILLNANSHLSVGRIEVGGRLEFAVSDGKGTLFVNVASRNEIAVIDLESHTLAKRIALAGCEEPTGIAYDQTYDLIVSVCSNGVAKFVDPRSSRSIASIAVGRGADAVLIDSVRQVVFSPGGDEGTLSIIGIRSRSDIALVQTLRTQRGVRLGAVHLKSGRLYLPAARYLSAPAPGHLPSPVPGSFEILEIAPQ